jgi:hypothetical protein
VEVSSPAEEKHPKRENIQSVFQPQRLPQCRQLREDLPFVEREQQATPVASQQM